MGDERRGRRRGSGEVEMRKAGMSLRMRGSIVNVVEVERDVLSVDMKFGVISLEKQGSIERLRNVIDLQYVW